MNILIRLFMKNRGISFSQAVREVKAQLAELNNDKSINPVGFMIGREKSSMMSNELQEFEAQYS